MPKTESTPSVTDAELRTLAKELGINKKSTGRTVEEVVTEAATQEDPAAHLRFLAEYFGLDATVSAEADVSAGTDIVLPTDKSTQSTEADAPEVVRTPIVAVLASKDGTGYISRHIDVRLTDRQSRALARLTSGLQQIHAMYVSRTGARHVDTKVDAVRWLLDTIADQEEHVSDAQEENASGE